MTRPEREPTEGAANVGATAALLGFLPAMLLTLAPWLHPHPALGAAPLLALPLFLLAAVQALGYRYEAGYMSALRARGPSALLFSFAALALLAVAIGLPTLWLQRSGALAPVLLLSAGVAGAWLLAWRVWTAPGLIFLWDDAVRHGRFAALSRCLDMAGRLSDGRAGGWRAGVAASVLLVLGVATLAVGWADAWPSPAWRLGALTVHALLLAPALALSLVELTAQRLLQPQEQPQEQQSTNATDAAGAQDADIASPEDVGADAGDPQQRLYAAARAGRVDDALALLDSGAHPHALPDGDARDQRTLPMLATLLSDLRLLRALIAAGVDLNRRHAGLTPLLAATRDSYHGRPDAVTTLLANGADPRAADGDGGTPLHGAARSADPAVAALLIDAGAELDAIDRDGWSPLGTACANGNWRLARFLLERGARCEPAHGQPALLAASGGEDDSAGVALLLKHKARVDARGRLQRSALHAACLAGNAEIAGALIAAGADVNARDELGVTALLDAARSGSAAVLRALQPQRPDPLAVDHAGRNALAIACQNGRCDVAGLALLQQLGVDPQHAGNDGRRPLDHAVAAGRWALVAQLDPSYALPACLADDDDELVDAPPLARLRLALENGRLGAARELRDLLVDSDDELRTLFLDLAAHLPPPALHVLAERVDHERRDAHGDTLLLQMLARGPDAIAAARVLLDRGATPSGGAALSRYLAAVAGTTPAAPGRDAETFALQLLDRGADAFAAFADNDPPLLQALRLGWLDLFDALLARGADPQTRSASGHTALLLACADGNEAALRRLIAHGAQPSARAADGQTALGLALSSGKRELSRWLDWPLWPLPSRPLRAADLPQAAQRGDVAAVERLLDLGLPIHAVDAQGCTALLRASGGGHPALVTLLLDRGADAALAATSGATCLSAALSMKHAEVLRLLLDRGAPPDQTLPGELTPLMVAAGLGQPHAVSSLLAHGADATRRDAEGGTALHAAAQFGFAARDRGVALSLWDALPASSDLLNQANARGETPLLLLLGAAAEAGVRCDEDVVLAQLERLLARGASIAAQERRGFGPLHLAGLHGLGRVVRALLAAGADPDQRDSINRRPNEIALMRGFVDIAAEFAPGIRPPPSMARFLREPRS
jgi:ankyrin repeat protein